MAGASEKENEREREKDVPSLTPLHNFTLPSRLKWGHQKHLRCVKPHPYRSSTNSNSGLNSTAPSTNHPRKRSNLPPIATPHKNVKAKFSINTNTTTTTLAAAVPAGDTTGIEAVCEQFTSDLKVAGDQLKFPILEEKEKDGNNDNNNEKKPSEEELPWNLRTRRPAGKASNKGGNVRSSPLQQQESGLWSLLASDKGEGSCSDNQQRQKFSLALSKEEVETDFLLMTGAKPPKRPKFVQKLIDALSAGSWVTKVTPENYIVPDVPKPKGDK